MRVAITMFAFVMMMMMMMMMMMTTIMPMRNKCDMIHDMGCADPRALPDSLQPLLVTLPLRAHAEMVRCVDIVTTMENGVSVTGERAVHLFERSSPRLSSINMNLAVTLNKKTQTLY